MLLIPLLFILISSTHAMERCNRNCNSYISLKNNEIKLDTTKIWVNLKVTIYPESVEVFILTRKIWRHITTGSDGATTKELTKGPYLPDAVEAQDWLLKKKCQIGSVCYPNGDCFGGGLQHCNGLGLNPKWVENKNMEIEGAQWNTPMVLWNDRCVQDWSCNIRTHNSIVYVDDNGYAFVNNGGNRTYLYKDVYNNNLLYVTMIKDVAKPNTIYTNSSCNDVNGDLWCNWEDGDQQRSFHFEKGVKCTNLKNFYACRPTTKAKRGTPELEMTIDDGSMLNAEIGKFIVKQNFNNVQFQNEIYGLKNIINRLVISSSRYNPFIIKDITGQHVYVQKRGKYMSACPCKDLENDCKLNKLVHEGDSKCSVSKKPTEIDIIEMEDVVPMIPDNVEFRGKDENVYETEIEREASVRESFINKNTESDSGLFSSLSGMPGFGMFAGVTALLPYVNLALILFRR